MPQIRLPSATITRARSIPIERIINERGIKLRGKIDRSGPCPLCGGDDRFAINTKKQVWLCRGCAPKGGDGIKLVQHLDGVGFREACAQLSGERFISSGSDKRDEIEQEPRIDCTYDYVDEHGALLFQAVRFFPKDFKQRRPGERPDQWIWSLGDTRRVLYRLPELIEAVGCGKIIFICEGEKDADNLAALGFTATTNALGAGKWLPEYGVHFRGADVVIIPDNDKTGRDHANKVATALKGIAKKIRVLEILNIWPECGPTQDVSDWLSSGGGGAGILKTAIDALPVWTQTATPLMSLTSLISPEPELDAWPVLDDAAYHGLVGEIVRMLEPHTEADPVGILLQLLVTFGNVIGHSPYYLVESDRHHANLFAVLVGTSAKGRKGTSAGRVRAVIKDADEIWCTERCVSGLSSGEGLINAVRDEVKKWNAKEQCEETLDPGIHDKRLMVTEPEFAGALSVMERHGKGPAHQDPLCLVNYRPMRAPLPYHRSIDPASS